MHNLKKLILVMLVVMMITNNIHTQAANSKLELVDSDPVHKSTIEVYKSTSSKTVTINLDHDYDKVAWNCGVQYKGTYVSLKLCGTTIFSGEKLVIDIYDFYDFSKTDLESENTLYRVWIPIYGFISSTAIYTDTWIMFELFVQVIAGEDNEGIIENIAGTNELLITTMAILITIPIIRKKSRSIKQ